MKIIKEFSVCGNCIQAIANDDYSGMSDEEAEKVSNTISKEEVDNRYLVIGDGENEGFSWRNCDLCNDLPGERYKAALLG